MKPRLKGAVWERDGEEIRLVYDIRDRFVIQDPQRTVETLLELLREGGKTLDELADALIRRGREVTVNDVASALSVLDAHRLLENEDHVGGYGAADRERYFSNLAFFEGFATLDRSREDFQRALGNSHVLVLGTGGLNSNTIPHLCGLGVGRLTLLDHDAVESRNFARQYLYRQTDIGIRKVHAAARWVRAFDPKIDVQAWDISVRESGDVVELVDRFAPDVVMSGIDSPQGIDDWVNAACVSQGTPYVRGGMWVTQGSVWSVDPGVSACRACSVTAWLNESGATADDDTAAIQLFARKPRENRGIGPVAGLLGALSAFEVLRYLTRFEPPAYAGRRLVVDFADGCTMSHSPEWPVDPSCGVCREGVRTAGVQ